MHVRKCIRLAAKGSKGGKSKKLTYWGRQTSTIWEGCVNIPGGKWAEEGEVRKSRQLTVTGRDGNAEKQCETDRTIIAATGGGVLS